jgi:hypothetical protein
VLVRGMPAVPSGRSRPRSPIVLEAHTPSVMMVTDSPAPARISKTARISRYPARSDPLPALAGYRSRYREPDVGAIGAHSRDCEKRGGESTLGRHPVSERGLGLALPWSSKPALQSPTATAASPPVTARDVCEMARTSLAPACAPAHGSPVRPRGPVACDPLGLERVLRVWTAGEAPDECSNPGPVRCARGDSSPPADRHAQAFVSLCRMRKLPATPPCSWLPALPTASPRSTRRTDPAGVGNEQGQRSRTTKPFGLEIVATAWLDRVPHLKASTPRQHPAVYSPVTFRSAAREASSRARWTTQVPARRSWRIYVPADRQGGSSVRPSSSHSTSTLASSLITLAIEADRSGVHISRRDVGVRER